jgi:Fe-S cluster assembly protein SufD
MTGMITNAEKRNLTQDIQDAFTHAGLPDQARRRKALDLFLAKGIPGPKAEEYKFIPIARTMEKIMTAVPSSTQTVSSPAHIQELSCHVIAFVNGKFSKEKSNILDQELTLSLSACEGAEESHDPFDLLNQAFAYEVTHITVGSKLILKHPVAIVYYNEGGLSPFIHPRWRFTLGNSSQATLMEYSIGTSQVYFQNKQSVIEVGENAQLEYTIIQNGPATDVQVNNTVVHLSSRAQASCFTFTFDGQLIRNNLTLTVDGEGVDAHLYGLYLLSKSTIADNHTVVDHRKANSYSNELYKGVMEGNAKGVFNGKIYVRPQAQKTNAFQSNRNILLSDTATVNTKPQLEIWADDVKCSHGCTTGQLDEEALFYLRSRGLSKEVAKSMLLYAFASEVLTSMKNVTIRNFVDGLVSERLHKIF